MVRRECSSPVPICVCPELKAELFAQNNEAEQDSSMAHPAVWQQYHSLACAPQTF